MNGMICSGRKCDSGSHRDLANDIVLSLLVLGIVFAKLSTSRISAKNVDTVFEKLSPLRIFIYLFLFIYLLY